MCIDRTEDHMAVGLVGVVIEKRQLRAFSDLAEVNSSTVAIEMSRACDLYIAKMALNDEILARLEISPYAQSKTAVWLSAAQRSALEQLSERNGTFVPNELRRAFMSYIQTEVYDDIQAFGLRLDRARRLKRKLARQLLA